MAYATKSAIGVKNSKATILGYRSLRGFALSKSAGVTFTDALGTQYEKYLDIPENTRNYLSKLLNKKFDKKGEDDESSPSSPQNDEDAMETEEQPKTAALPKAKRQRVTADAEISAQQIAPPKAGRSKEPTPVSTGTVSQTVPGGSW